MSVVRFVICRCLAASPAFIGLNYSLVNLNKANSGKIMFFVFIFSELDGRPLGLCIFSSLRCFDIGFQRPYRYFSITLKVILSLSDRYKIFTSNWLGIEICENVVLSKIDITMTTINKKKLKLIKAEFCMI